MHRRLKSAAEGRLEACRAKTPACGDDYVKYIGTLPIIVFGRTDTGR